VQVLLLVEVLVVGAVAVVVLVSLLLLSVVTGEADGDGLGLGKCNPCFCPSGVAGELLRGWAGASCWHPACSSTGV
jgi:hypothetical protein